VRKLIGNERGSEKVYTAIGFSIIIVMIFLGIKVGLPFLKNMTLSNYAEELVNFDYMNSKPNPSGVRTIHSKLINRIKKKGMPIPEKTVKVDYDYTKYRIRIEYKYPVDFYIFKTDISFSIDKSSKK